MYSIVTTWWRWSVRGALAGFSFLPAVMLVSFFVVLPRDVLQYQGVGRTDDDEGEEGEEVEGFLGQPSHMGEDSRSTPSRYSSRSSFIHTFKRNLRRTKKLFYPYMLPLLLVYIAEYTINQGVSPTLLFGTDQPDGRSIPSPPFEHFRDFYPTYNTIYQLGVFISRSSHLLIRIHALYPPSLLQCLNLALLTLQALYPFIPNVYIVFLVIFWEGLLGGAVYVNTFARISEDLTGTEREYSLGAVTVADSGGICIAGFLGLWLEGALCRWQVDGGRTWCKLME